MRQVSHVLAVVFTSVAVWACGSSSPRDSLANGAGLSGDDDDNASNGTKNGSTTPAHPTSSATAATAPLLPPLSPSDPAEDDTNDSPPVTRSDPAMPSTPPAAPPFKPSAPDVATCEATCIAQHQAGVLVERQAGPAFLACICGAPACADVCGQSSFCVGSTVPLAQDAACGDCLDTTDSPDVDACFVRDEALCPRGSDCDALRGCLDACEGP